MERPRTCAVGRRRSSSCHLHDSAAALTKRADLDLQISLLTEHELTKLATLLHEMARKMGVKTQVEGELDEVKRDVAPDSVLDAIEEKAS